MGRVEDQAAREWTAPSSQQHQRPLVTPGQVLAAMLQPRFPLMGGWSTSFKFGWVERAPIEVDVASGTVSVAYRMAPAIYNVPYAYATSRVRSWLCVGAHGCAFFMLGVS